MEKVRNNIFVYRQVTLVDLTGKGKSVQVFNGRTFFGMNHGPVLHETDTVDLTPRSSLSKLLDCVIKFATADYVDSPLCNFQRLRGENCDVGTGKYGN